MIMDFLLSGIYIDYIYFFLILVSGILIAVDRCGGVLCCVCCSISAPFSVVNSLMGTLLLLAG